MRTYKMTGLPQTDKSACYISNRGLICPFLFPLCCSFHFAFSLHHSDTVLNTDGLLLCCVVYRLTFPRGHFPRLAECAHFHYETVDFGNVQVSPEITVWLLQQRVTIFRNCVFGSSSADIFVNYSKNALLLKCNVVIKSVSLFVCYGQSHPHNCIFLPFPEMPRYHCQCCFLRRALRSLCFHYYRCYQSHLCWSCFQLCVNPLYNTT